MKRWIGKWRGGRILEVDGRKVWYVRKRLGNGARREFAIADSEDEALAEWALFKRDPANYQTKKQQAASAYRDDATGAVRLDGPTVDAFLEHANVLVAKGELTKPYVDYTLGPYLVWWGKMLAGRDLHRVRLEELQKALKGPRARHKRITALKAFARWAREEKDPPRLRRRDDPTIDLKTPPIIPAQSVKPKGYPLRVIEQLYAELPSQAARDTVCLRAKANGMHDTEIGRIASGEAVLRRVSDPSGIEGVIVFFHKKKGEKHAIACDAQTFAAAERIQARKTPVSRNAMKVMVDRACKRAGLKTGTPNRVKGSPTGHDTVHPNELRHSFATWARTVGEEVYPVNQKGVDLEKVAEAMGHRRKSTTKGFYVGDMIPMMIRLPLRLEHPNDPIVLAPSRVRRRAK